MDCSPPGSSVGFPRQEYWSGLPFPSPGDLPDPGMEPTSSMSPAFAQSHPKGDQSWVFTGRTDVEAETPILWPPDTKS